MFLFNFVSATCPTRTVRDTPLAVKLRASRELIVKGWCQGQLYAANAPNIRYCAIGAMQIDGDIDEEQARFFQKTNNIDSIPDWNDRWWRTKGSVPRAFDRAIDHANSQAA